MKAAIKQTLFITMAVITIFSINYTSGMQLRFNILNSGTFLMGILEGILILKMFKK